MIELGPATEDEMVPAFLRAEVESSRFGGRYPSHFANFGQFEFDQRVLIDAPDLHSDQQNAIRWWILAAERGYGIGLSLFTGFPYDVAWRRVALQPTDFWRLRYGQHDNW